MCPSLFCRLTTQSVYKYYHSVKSNKFVVTAVNKKTVVKRGAIFYPFCLHILAHSALSTGAHAVPLQTTLPSMCKKSVKQVTDVTKKR